MKTYFICSDIHSFYTEWRKALRKSGFDMRCKDHILIICGDLFDRGTESRECLDFVCKLIDKDRAICIKGNHEEMLEEVFERGFVKSHDMHNGTDKTIHQLADLGYTCGSITSEELDKVVNDSNLNKYLNACKDYCEIGKYIFVHGWIPFDKEYDANENNYLFGDCKYKPIYNKDWRNMNWEDARWVNGMKMWHEGIIEPNKTIVCGHWHTAFGHSNYHSKGLESLNQAQILMSDDELRMYLNARTIDKNVTKLYNKYCKNEMFKDDGIIALDACTVLSRRVNVLKLTERTMKIKHED